MQQYLLVSLIYEDKLAPITPIIKIVAEHHAIIKASRLLTSGDKQSLQMQIKGPWNEIVKLEQKWDTRKMSVYFRFEFLIDSAITAITQLKMKFLKEQKGTDN